MTDAFTREAVAFIETHQKQPFFLLLSYNAPHTPLEASETHLNRVIGVTGGDHRRRVYSAMIAALDEGVGALQTKLKETGVLAGHADLLPQRQWRHHRLPESLEQRALVGARPSCSKAAFACRCSSSGRASSPRARFIEPMVSVLDVVPTVLAAAGDQRSKRPRARWRGPDALPDRKTSRSASCRIVLALWPALGRPERALQAVAGARRAAATLRP